jgi:DNA polymerase (family X)
MMKIKGIGPKRVRQLWREAGIETPEALLEACESGAVAKLKGFGQKTQDQIQEAIVFVLAARGQVLISQADALAAELLTYLHAQPAVTRAEVAGQTRRSLEIVDEVVVVAAVEADQFGPVLAGFAQLNLVPEPRRSGPRAWRGTAPAYAEVPVVVLLTSPENFVNEWFLASGSAEHLDAELPPSALEWLAPTTASAPPAPRTLRHVAQTSHFQTETALYAAAGLRQFIVPELRENLGELDLAAVEKIPTLIESVDLRGALHNHSTYSDGIHTLRRMAEYLRDAGYEYLGICDHSRSAGYANGLPDFRVREQWREIDHLNAELAPFRIFKGIESDILTDGSLDYDADVLAGFDFVVASVHSVLRMDEAKATTRLLRAIENPFTTMLGHPTGRLLLRREGYPLDFKVIIDACAAYGVAIELNSNPWRLDLDWRWLQYALEKGVLTALNPDAHSISGYADMHYGVRVGRKAYLTAEKTLNTWSVAKLAAWFDERKAQRR